MKNTIKNLINQVKKALANKSGVAVFEQAYADGNGNLLARSLKDNADILVFVGGIIEDMTARQKMYNKDALTLAADTGIFKGGTEVLEGYPDIFTTPNENFTPVCKISVDDLKAAAYTASKDNTRPVLTGINFTPDGIMQSVDGFRAYRKKCEPLNFKALNDFEKEHGFILSAAAAAYGFKGVISVSLSSKYIRLEDTAGLVLFVRKIDGQFVNLETIYKTDGKPTNTAKIKAVKEFTSVLKTAKAAQSKAERNQRGVFLRLREGAIDYYIPVLDIYGTIEAETDINAGETTALFNPSYLYDAIANQNCCVFEMQTEHYKPVFIRNTANRFEMNGDALVLPIRHDELAPFEKYDKERKEAAEKKQQPTPAADPEKEAPQEAAAPVEKLEIVKREEITPPEVVKARRYYKQMRACNFKPTAIQEAEAETIYKLNREQLQPIARKAGNLYIDTLSIIAAIMSVYDN